MTALLTFAARHWKLFGLVALFALLAVQTARVDRLKDDITDHKATITAVKAERDGWKASYGESEGRRASEKAEAVTSATEASSACDARIAEARRSARAIERIITKEPARDQNGCHRRELVDAGQLRDALRPAD